MTNEQRRQLNRELYNYKEYKGKVKETLEDAFYGGLTLDYSNIRVNSSGGNSAENRMIKALSDSERMSLWIRVFEFTLIKYTGEHKDLVLRKKYIEGKKKYQICREAAISPRTYDYWISELLEVAFRWARIFKVL